MAGSEFSEETLQAFALGRLPADEAGRVEDAAARDPDVAAQLALLRGIVRARDEDPARNRSTELGWARLSRAIDAEPSRVHSKRLLPWTIAPWQGAAAASVAAVTAWQLTVAPIIAARSAQPAGSEYATASGPIGATTASPRFIARVAFLPTAKEGEIRALLIDLGGQISGGPSAIGLYDLSFPNERQRAKAVRQLEARHEIVETVETE